MDRAGAAADRGGAWSPGTPGRVAGSRTGPGLEARPLSAVVIRLCREEDLPALEEFGAFIGHRQILREAFALQLEDEVVMLVAEAGGDLIGQAWLDFRPRLGAHGPRVWAVGVLDALQGEGVGRKLMEAVEAVARAHGCPRLELGVEKDNLPAQAFYERLGWRVVGELGETCDDATPDAQDLDEWVLVKELI